MFAHRDAFPSLLGLCFLAGLGYLSACSDLLGQSGPHPTPSGAGQSSRAAVVAQWLSQTEASAIQSTSRPDLPPPPQPAATALPGIPPSTARNDDRSPGSAIEFSALPPIGDDWKVGLPPGCIVDVERQMNESRNIRRVGYQSPSTGSLGGAAPMPAEDISQLLQSPVAVAPQNCADDPHALVFSRTAFPSATECAACHQQIYDEWAISSHAYASISPMFHAFENKINMLSQGTIGYFCLRCHAPVATTMGLRRDQAIWDGPAVFREGVTCVACHRVKTPYTKANGERRIEPGDLSAPVYGSGDGRGVEQVLNQADSYKVKWDPRDPKPGQVIHLQAIQFEELKESSFCMSCHQVAVQPGIKLEVVWDQYRASPACREGISCQDCHMGKVPGRSAGYEVAPAAIVENKPINPDRRHSNHIFHGPGYSIAHPGVFPQNKAALKWSFNDWQLFDWRSGWGTEAFEDAVSRGQIPALFPAVWANRDDRMDAREVLDQNLSGLARKDENRKQVLELNSKVDGPFFLNDPSVGEPLQFYYCVTNLNNGHNMPSGSLGAQHQIWVNVALIGPDGLRLWESGYLDCQGDLADLHSSDVLNRRIPFDEQLMNFQTKFITTNVKGTDREMYLPVNVDIDQIPFLRPPPQPTTVINHPPFIRMEAHSLPPLGSRKAKYSVPADLIRQPGTYRLSIRLRSRLEPMYFMRFCDATPEMIRTMQERTMDFHVHSVVFEVK
ncbi:MAG: multiheme c-type cytochrome [Planctomycetota bacterium]